MNWIIPPADKFFISEPMTVYRVGSVDFNPPLELAPGWYRIDGEGRPVLLEPVEVKPL